MRFGEILLLLGTSHRNGLGAESHRCVWVTIYSFSMFFQYYHLSLYNLSL